MLPGSETERRVGTLARRRSERRAQTSEAAFVAFFSQEYPALERTVRMIVRDRWRAEEITQDAFVQLFSRWSSIERYERPGAWVRRVAIRMAVRAANRERVRAVIERQSRSEPRDPIVDIDLAAAIRELPPTQQAALVLFYLEDLPVAEVARILGRPEVTVRSSLHRARRRLAEILREDEGDELP
ncbi:MAG: RNA polymerase sigma factor [Actinomycetota bacterium]